MLTSNKVVGMGWGNLSSGYRRDKEESAALWP